MESTQMGRGGWEDREMLQQLSLSASLISSHRGGTCFMWQRAGPIRRAQRFVLCPTVGTGFGTSREEAGTPFRPSG